MVEKEEKILQVYAKSMRSESLPQPRFGHTVNQISKTSIVVFGGAISAPGNYTMSAELYLYDIPKNQWKQLTPSNPGSVPHARAAHASATVRENQLLLYGGSIGNGQYAHDELWFLDIKNNIEATWMKVPIEGPTPGPRYGHSMVYIIPYLILFGGSLGGISNQKNETMNDIWIFGTDITPFTWQKVIFGEGPSPVGRLYHSACVINKYNDRSDGMVLFGGRDAKNSSLKDLYVLKKNRSEYIWENISYSESSIAPIARHQQCSTVFGPFLFVVGGRAQNASATFDVFSFVSKSWYRLGTIGLFRHSIWIYFNLIPDTSYELSLYIYGGFDSENNSQINSNLYKIDIKEIFNKNETLKNELANHIKNLVRKTNIKEAKNSKVREEETRGHFELNSRVIVYNIPDENNFGSLIKEVSYSKLTEADKKINEKDAGISGLKKKETYNEDNAAQFLQLLTNPEEEFIPSNLKPYTFLKDKDSILALIADAKKLLEKTPTVITLRSPVKIYGSINGQYNDLIRYFNLFGRPSEFKGDIECMDYLFLGNIVNRGAFSVEVLCLLLALKLKYPKNFHILRGSHEDLEICKQFGFADECKSKYMDNIEDKNSIFKNFCDLFEYLPLAAIVNNQILCVHGGIGDHCKSLNDLNLKKPIKISHFPVAQEVLWNSPIEYLNKEYTSSNSTTKYRNKSFNEKKVNEFLKENNLNYLLRSHDIIKNGIDKIYNNKVITIFSAPNYCGVHNNNGAIIIIKKNYEMQPKILVRESNYDVWIPMKDNECPPSPLRK